MYEGVKEERIPTSARVIEYVRRTLNALDQPPPASKAEPDVAPNSSEGLESAFDVLNSTQLRFCVHFAARRPFQTKFSCCRGVLQRARAASLSGHSSPVASKS